MELPETRYAQSGDVAIAFQVVGDGPFDVVWVPGGFSHVEFIRQVPVFKTLLDGLASFSRVIFFDKRGTGMSDRVVGIPDLETRMDDVRAVMDAAGSEHAAVFGPSESVPMSVLFAATYPERTWALALYGGMARMLRAPDYPWGETEAEYRQAMARSKALWMTPGGLEESSRRSAPNGGEDEIRALAALMRHSLSPGAEEALDLMNMQIDVRHVLPAIRVPTLVLHRPLDADVPIEHGRYIAQRIPGATFIELPGTGHVGSAAELPPIMEEMERFFRRVWDAGVAVDREPDRVLATVLFTDIVGSSERATELGDRAWLELLERHHELVRRELGAPPRCRGQHGRRRLLRQLRRAGAGDSLRQCDHQGGARVWP